MMPVSRATARASLKTFMGRVGMFAAIQSLIAVGVILYGSPRESSDHYYAALYDKQDLSREAPSPRILFVGGSSVAFGVDSVQVRDQLGLNPVNTGLNAHLGLEFILNFTEPIVKSGDLVVLLPEYSLIASSHGGIPLAKDAIRGHCPDFEKYFRPLNQPPRRPDAKSIKHALDKRGLQVAHQWVRRAYHRATGKKHKGVYIRHSFNEHGDMIAHHHQPAPPELTQMEPIKQCDRQALAYGVACVRKFVHACRRKGARVVVSFPPTPREKFDQSKEAIDQIHLALVRGADCPIILRPEDFVFQRDWFYDTASHLTQAGAQIRTQRLIDGLLPVLTESSDDSSPKLTPPIASSDDRLRR